MEPLQVGNDPLAICLPFFFIVVVPLLSSTTKWSRLILHKPAPASKVAMSLNNPGFFEWAKVLETKVGVPRTLITVDPF